MRINLHTTHSLFQNRLILTIINSLLKKPLFILRAAFFFSCLSNVAFANFSVALIDTGFCPEKIHNRSVQHIIEKVIDLTDSVSIDCSKITANELQQSRRFHGQKVLNEFLKFLPKETKITIFPLVVYDARGNQNESAWKRAIEFIEKKKVPIVLSASGLLSPKKITSSLPSIWFVPSGRIERSVSAKTILFPQSLAPQINLFIIGDYFDEGQIIYDQALLYQEKIDYYFPSGKGDFQGTSRAVAQALGLAISKCMPKGNILSAFDLRFCLNKTERVLIDPILKKQFKTF